MGAAELGALPVRLTASLTLLRSSVAQTADVVKVRTWREARDDGFYTAPPLMSERYDTQTFVVRQCISYGV